MYAMKPIIGRTETTNRDDCMYSMKKIHGVRSDDHACNANETVTDITVKNPLPDVAVMEARQEMILLQIASLREQVLSLYDVLNVTREAGETSQGEVRASSSGRREPVLAEVVVKVDPSKPCYAVRALAKLWRDVDFDVTCYTHSDVLVDVPEFRVERKENFADCVKLSLIWKRVEDLEVVIAGLHGYPLIGETNLLRYLVRRLSGNVDDKLLTQEARSSLDCILDLSHRLNYQESPKDVQSTLSKIGEQLGTNDWLTSFSEAGVADVAAWSAIKRASVVKLPSNLVAWFDRCDKYFL